VDFSDHAGGLCGECHAGLDMGEFGRLIPKCRDRGTIVRYRRLERRREAVDAASYRKIVVVVWAGLPADWAWEGRG